MKDSTRQKIESLRHEILSYYKNHSSRMTGLHFHINPAAIEGWIKEQNINKEPIVRVYPSEEELRTLYLNQNKSKAEIAEMFDIAYNTHNGNSMSKLGFEFISYSKHGVLNVSTCKEVTEKFGAVFGRKPEKNREIQEYIKEGKILSVYDAGVKKYIWTSTSNTQ